MSNWTPEICRDRMAACRRYARRYHAMPRTSARYSYRWLNAQFYMQHRDRLAALNKHKRDDDRI